MDADLQHPPEVIPELVKAIENGADVAVASRYVPAGRSRTGTGTGSSSPEGAIMVGRLALPKIRNVKDPVSGFFALRRGGSLRGG